MYVTESYYWPNEEAEWEIVFTREDKDLYWLLQEGLKEESLWEEAEPTQGAETFGGSKGSGKRVQQSMLQYARRKA